MAKYIPKTIPILEVDIPESYHHRVQEVMDAFESGRLASLPPDRPYLESPGVMAAIKDLGSGLSGKMSRAAKAYDILFLTLLVKEVEHNRKLVDSPNIRSGQFEQDLIRLLQKIKESEDPEYLDTRAE